jgi:UDP-N-acetylmuramoyl-L-alanyl-D-glutamate--2,6-diaminopimelate ligase
MRLSDVLPTEIAPPPGSDEIVVSGITAASAAAAPGVIFAGLPGTKVDGAAYIPDAVARGARVVIAGRGKAAAVPPGVTLIEVENPRRMLALIAAKFAGRQPAVAVAVTGTSGKTSVADFTRQIFSALGRSAASLGTIGVVKPSGAIYGSLTTPDPVTLHATLASLADEDVTHLAFEASSHGLDQHRLDGVKLSAAAFTNLGRDHMDYHPTVEAYLAAKLRLFTELLRPGQVAVVNTDGAYADRVVSAACARGLNVLTVGSTGETLRRLSLTTEGFAQRMTVAADGRTYDVMLPLVGAYQAENALTAAGLAIAAGENTERVLAALATLHGVPGRLEIVGQAKGGLAVVDYAHKPEALTAALSACRPFVTGRLICVFGCGGDRDKGKRPIMGQIAVQNADVVIVTDDNPRTEVSSAIRAEILSAAPGALEIGDRADAIRHAITMMRTGDVVLVAGKGHETGQIIGANVVPFSDHDEIAKALAGVSEGQPRQ